VAGQSVLGVNDVVTSVYPQLRWPAAWRWWWMWWWWCANTDVMSLLGYCTIPN